MFLPLDPTPTGTEVLAPLLVQHFFDPVLHYMTPWTAQLPLALPRLPLASETTHRCPMPLQKIDPPERPNASLRRRNTEADIFGMDSDPLNLIPNMDIAEDPQGGFHGLANAVAWTPRLIWP